MKDDFCYVSGLVLGRESINAVKQINDIIVGMQISMLTSQERKFWECVKNAL